jgi:hypothetical protein
MVFASSGCASSSSSLIHTVVVSTARAMSALVSRSIFAASSGLISMSKSSRVQAHQRVTPSPVCKPSPSPVAVAA